MLLIHYFKIGIRNLFKHLTVSLSIVLGFALSVSVILPLVVLMDNKEQYDNSHKIPSDKIYRIITRVHESTWATSPLPIAERIKNYSTVESVISVVPQELNVGLSNMPTFTIPCAFVDNSFFNTFNFSELSSNKSLQQLEPFSILLSESAAVKIFGKKDVIGSVLEIEGYSSVVVAGIFPKTNQKTHIDFEAYLSMPTALAFKSQGKMDGKYWDWNTYSNCYNYVVTKDVISKSSLESSLDQISKSVKFDEKINAIEFRVQPVRNIVKDRLHADTLEVRSQPNLFIYALLGVILFFLATFNYINLSVTRSVTRSREIGIKRVFGAPKQQIFYQFILESVIIAIFSLILGTIIMLFLPLREIQEIISNSSFSYSIIIRAVVFGLILGLLGGIIPSLILSNTKIIDALKNYSKVKKVGTFSIQRIFLILQFSISIIAVIVLLIFISQSKFMMRANYGFKMDNIVSINLEGLNHRLLEQEAIGMSNVKLVSACSDYFGSMPESVVIKSHPDSLPLQAFQYFVDENFINIFNLTLVAGKSFSDNLSNGVEKHIIINERAARQLSFVNAHEAIGALITVADTIELTVQGVLKDFHFDNFKRPIGPLVLRIDQAKFQYLLLQMSDRSQASQTVQDLKTKYKNVTGFGEFDYEFYDEKFKERRSYSKDIHFLIIVSIYAVCITCLSLLAMTIHSMNQKSREISIRKVYGAMNKDIIFSLSKDFFVVFIISILLAIPIAYYSGNLMLRQFVYKIDISAGLLLIPTIVIILSASAIVCAQALVTSRKNPANNLRYE